MTQDFKEDFINALYKEGYEYMILVWKPDQDGLIQDLNIFSGIEKLDAEYPPYTDGKIQTKKDSILIAAKQSLDGQFDQ